MPVVTVCGKTHKSSLSFKPKDAPVGSVRLWHEKAWTNCDLGVKWFTDVLFRSCGLAHSKLLIVDQHHSHEVLELAVMENIRILAVPLSVTHHLQPLGFFLVPMTLRHTTAVLTLTLCPHIIISSQLCHVLLYSVQLYWSGPDKYFYISLAPWLVTFKYTSSTNFLLAPKKITSY